MRERTPSADDTPKRAPPAPPREAASADVAGSKTSSEAVEVFRAAKFTPTTAASPTAAPTTSSVDARMVASTHNLDDLTVSHPASASGDRQQQQEKHGHAYRSAQTAQDKRSRLSNVINNLRKKVPDSRNGDSPRKEEDDRNSVERNLETLEKYVMTVLNGVIKDEEEDDRDVGRKKDEKGKELDKTEDQEDEDSKGAKFEPSKPNESRTEAAVFPAEQTENPLTSAEPCPDYQKLDIVEEKQDCLASDAPSEDSCKGLDEEEVFKGGKCSRERKSESLQDARNEGQEEERKESRSLGTIIMERLIEHQAEDKGSSEAGKEEPREFAENVELRNVCRDLLNDLLNSINQLIDENSQESEETKSSVEDCRDSRSQEFSMTSLHCSLPLDKVASVLQSCQANESNGPQSPSSPSSSSASSQGSKSPSKPPSPTVRHLCLYCDRKFLSISLRQRHTERVHQQGGGRRSERNSRKPSQNCQYCSDKCSESLEGLFQHMVGSHGDKYHACVQCSTRYLTREALAGHMSENHGVSVERSLQTQEKVKEPSPCKELGNQSPRDKLDPPSPKERRSEDPEHEHRTEPILLKPIVPAKDSFSNPGSPEFDSSFYSSVSCNIRENLLHHLDGKLQSSSSTVTSASSPLADAKPQPQQQTFYDHSQIQFPIDISLTAATPVYSKEYTSDEYENSSEYAQKPGKSNRSHPRRVSFEKYNFPRKYDGKEQWTCSIKDLSKFDISTQLSLRKKQQLLKERATLNRLHQIPSLGPSETTEIAQEEQKHGSRDPEEAVEDVPRGRSEKETEQATPCEAATPAECVLDEPKCSQATEFTVEFGNFLRLRKWDEKMSNEAAKKQEVVYAELTGEWSRPRVYICGACASKCVTLKEMEDHKATTHPNVWCSHFEFSGDQRELYKHLFLPGRDVPTAKARSAVLAEKVCTKCTKNCATLPELHRHMLECGGDQAWLLGLFGNGKKKCKWRPFGSRSRRRRQRGMKRNIQNSQTPRVNTPREKQPAGPRVRPSDRESIQKMLANLPPKRTTRKVLQDSALRTQGRLRNVQTRSRPRMIGDNSTASRMSRNKAALRNKLLKNAKSIQRNRCRIDNISAVIESVVRNYNAEASKPEERASHDSVSLEDAKEKTEETGADEGEKVSRPRVVRGPRVLGKKRNVKTKDGAIKHHTVKKLGSLKARAKAMLKLEMKASKVQPKSSEKEADASPSESKSPGLSSKNKSAIQTTPKKKRPVDPVASLNASIKAKSQLRTLDGKFARNPNKDPSPQKSPEGRPVSRQLIKNVNEESTARSKLRLASKGRSEDQLPKRTTRLSSDSDKMPTLEPAVQVSSNSEEYTETSVSDLPILSPATSSFSQEKVLRGKNSVNKIAEERDGSKMEEVDEVDGRSEIGSEEEPRQGKGRRRNDSKSMENPKSELKETKIKEKFKRRNALKTPDEKNPRNKARNIEDDVPIKIKNVPFEVKKLIGSDNKEDLLTKLALTSRTTASRRCLRQPVARLKTRQGKLKIRRDLEAEMTKFDAEAIGDVPAKKDARRKSPRSVEKFEKPAPKEDKSTLEEVNRIRDGEVKVRGRRSLSGDKAVVNQVSESQSSDVDSETSNKRQTRSSLLNSNDVESQSKETSNEANDMSLKKNTSLGKRRGRIKSSNDVLDKRGLEASKTKNEEDKSNLTDQNESNAKQNSPSEDANKQEDNVTGHSNEDRPDTVRTDVGLKSDSLKLEASNSMDSGKENSLKPAPVVVQKSKVGRPRKSWGARRGKGTKRSLNNVIGILTEGMNIPVEAQQNVALTVQTSLEDADRAESNSRDADSKSGESERDKSMENDCPEAVDDSDKSIEESSVSEVAKDSKILESGDDKEPANDIILDLSRRKQKGKGSFLEKIVSKIAKQKDALLEGEVGCLLDTAADELTSILDEVAPGFPDNSEKSGKKGQRQVEKKSAPQLADQNSAKQEDVDREELVSKEEGSLIVDESDKNLLNSPENSIDVGKELVKDSVETSFVANGVLPAATAEGSASGEKSLTSDLETVVNDAKVTRKVNKRSLEGSSPRKNKRKSSETLPEELHLDVRNEESKNVPCTKENRDINLVNKVSNVTEERIQPGKRKSIDDAEESSSENRVCEEVDNKSNDPVDSVKKLKMDSEKIADEETLIAEEGVTENSPKIVNSKKTSENGNEEKITTPLRVTGKRKSCADTVEQNSESEASLRKTSKRRSQHEEKSNLEEEALKIDSVKETTEVAEVSRRRSSRTRSIQSKSEDEIQNDTENNSGAENPEESSKTNDLTDETIVQCNRKETKVTEEAKQEEGTATNYSVDPAKITEPIIVPKIPKKRGRKKKILTPEIVPAENVSSGSPDSKRVEPVVEKIPSRKSLRTNRSTDPEESSKIPDPSTLSSSLDNFKVPEVTEVLQHTKKRTYKRKSTIDEHPDCNTSLEPEAKIAESSETAKIAHGKEEPAENNSQNASLEGKDCSTRSSNRDQPEAEASNTSADLGQSKTRCSKRKQVSSDDLQNQGNLNHRTESVDSLSETSCVSESSYFRKKRFSKKKKEYREPSEDVQTDTSATDSESVDAEKNGDRRQSLKRRAKKNLRFFDDSLVDIFDIPMDTQEPVPPESSPKKLEEEVEPKSDTANEEKLDIPASDSAASVENEETMVDKVTVSEKSTVDDEEETKDAEDRPDTPAQGQEDFQAPKKRGAGNFVVVHKKTGEILIVEKQKKLTKEAARFFCNVCATSFTRKSSLKKHNWCQSHLLQVVKSKRGKTSTKGDEKDEALEEEACNDESDLILPPSSRRSSKERAKEWISMEVKQDMEEENSKKRRSASRNRIKEGSKSKDNESGSVNDDETTSNPMLKSKSKDEDDWRVLVEKGTTKNDKESGELDDCSVKNLSNKSSNLESSRSCSSLAPSRNSQTMKDSDEDEEDPGEERISPLLICGTPRSFTDSSSSSENEDEEDKAAAEEVASSSLQHPEEKDSEESKGNNLEADSLGDDPSTKHGKWKNRSNSRKKQEPAPFVSYDLILPPNSCRSSKERAKEWISMEVKRDMEEESSKKRRSASRNRVKDGPKTSESGLIDQDENMSNPKSKNEKQKKQNYTLRNQKDSGYGSSKYDEDLTFAEASMEDEKMEERDFDSSRNDSVRSNDFVDENKNAGDQSVFQESLKDDSSSSSTDLETVQEPVPEKSKEFNDAQTHRQRIEDELLDAEICKITENMSHDEYVVTEHTSPASTSTPVKVEPKKQDETKKKKRKAKKKNLADEHLSLDTPEPGLTVSSSDTSVKILKPDESGNSFLGEPLTSLNTEAQKEFSSTLVENIADLEGNEDVEMEEGTLKSDMNLEELSDKKIVVEKTDVAEKITVNQPHERLTLKFTINKRSLEHSAGSDGTKNVEEYECSKVEDGESTRGMRIEPETMKCSMDLNLEDLNDTAALQSVEEDAKMDSNEPEGIVEMENGSCNNVNAEDEPAKTTRHGKSKKGRGKKHNHELENPLINPVPCISDRSGRRTSRSRGNQSRQQVLEEVAALSEAVNSEKPAEGCSGTIESPIESNSDAVNDACALEKSSDDSDGKSDGLEIAEELDNSGEILSKGEDKIDGNKGNVGTDTRPLEDDEASSSSFADKPLSELLLETDERLGGGKVRDGGETCLDSSKNPGDLEGEGTPETVNRKAVGSEVDENSSDRKELIYGESQASSESENGASLCIETARNEEQCNRIEEKAAGNTRKLKKSHKNKENHRKSKGKKTSTRNKIAGLTSDSDDSDSGDKMESQNKNKIVKSVFGRVFGGEKSDKVKEVLNDWVSKSEDDSDMSRTGHQSAGSNDRKASEVRNEEKTSKKQSLSTSTASGSKKRSGQKSKKTPSSEGMKEKSPGSDNPEEHPSGKHGKSKNRSNSRKKHEAGPFQPYSLILPPTSCRSSKERAKKLISEELKLDLQKYSLAFKKQKKPNYMLRNQVKDITTKDSGCGSFNYDEDASNPTFTEASVGEDEKAEGRRKSSGSGKGKSKDEDDWRELLDKEAENDKDSGDEDGCAIKNLSDQDALASRLSVHLESSRSCSSLAPSSVRNRSPSMDRNSQTTRESDVEEDDVGHGRISPLFICGTPRSSIESSSNSENEEEEERNVGVSEAASRKRSSSEFSGEKVVIRSPSSTHKTEVVTIAPTDAIEDNALDVPQEIETAKPRQGKVLNFDEELFVECCSRLKATTENELRGAKKIKLDHSEGFHRKDEQQQGLRGPRDRWRDVESQNSLGSLLESVNQLLGEEMYSIRERDYPKRGGRNLRSEQSSRSASPDVSRTDNLGYEDSLDVAFEHNNKLRDKIQQRMRESESLIASTFGQKNSNEVLDDGRPSKNQGQDLLRGSYPHLQDHGHLSASNLSNGGYGDGLHVRNLQEQASGKVNLDSSGFKNKMNSSLGGLLDKALSNLLHSNGKHDHNGSTPMKVLAELACARAPTSTAEDPATQDHQPAKPSPPSKDLTADPNPLSVPKDHQKKPRNPIKELFEKKRELNERKQQEKTKTDAALRELNVHRQRKVKRNKKHQDFPLIRRNEHGGLVERKKRRDGFERKAEFASDRIKDVYEFDEEESQTEPNLGSVMSYRNRPGYEVSCLRTKEVDVAGLMSKAIGDSLGNGKTGDALSTRLESMIDRKFKELEKFAPKTKGALKAFQSEEHQQRQVTGPMDEFVERKSQKPRRPIEQALKHSKLKKRSKSSKKKARNAWYENDSSDEYRTAVKTEDVGVGISKSQRTCSKGKQNLFAELYTSSESEYDDEDLGYDSKKQRRVKKIAAKANNEMASVDKTQELINKYCSETEERVDDWGDQDLKNDCGKNDCDNKKSESELSDHPLVIDERKDTDDQRNSDEETENQYERNYVLDDLYREDSSIANSDIEEPAISEAQNVPEGPEVRSPNLPEERNEEKIDFAQEDELIPLEEALDLLDQANTALEANYENVNRESKCIEHVDTVERTESVNDTANSPEESTEKLSIPVEEQEEEPDNDLLSLPEKLSSNEKPQKESENLPLHVFLSRKVQESKKKKEQQLKKMQEEQERIMMDFQPTRRQRKCAIGKQGLLAEISSSDEETYPRERKFSESHEKPRKQKRESKEKRKERYMEKKHEQMIAKEQKAIEEEILRELGKKKESLGQNTVDAKAESPEDKVAREQDQKKRHQAKEKQKKSNKAEDDAYSKSNSGSLSDLENNCGKSESNQPSENNQGTPGKQKKHSKSPTKPRKSPKTEAKVAGSKKGRNVNGERSKSRMDSKGTKDKERRSSSGKRDSDDEELKTTKSWNKVEEGVGVAIGRRKRAAANQLYYWSSSSDEEEMLEVVPAVEEEEDDRQEQHGWIVGDSHKKMITMLAMEKQLKEKRRRSEDEFEPSKAKSKKHRNSTS